MKKYFPVILILVTLTLSACGVKTKDGNLTNNSTVTGEIQKTESKSLKDLLGLGTSQRCTFETKSEETEVKSEIVMNGKKFRQTSEITTKEGKMKVYAVSDGVYYYSWSDTAKDMGTKIKIEDVEKDNDEPVKMEGQQQISMDEKVDYKCTPATLTDADLAIPTDVKFLDYADIMKGFENMGELKNMVPQE